MSLKTCVSSNLGRPVICNLCLSVEKLHKQERYLEGKKVDLKKKSETECDLDFKCTLAENLLRSKTNFDKSNLKITVRLVSIRTHVSPF